MGSGVDVRDGRPVLVQRRADAEDVATLLRRIEGPGVPTVHHAEPGQVVTEWTPPLPEPHGAADLAGIASAVARAHGCGAVHGPFLPEHLRCGPLVSGWGEAPDGWTEADDVASFAAVLAAAGQHALAARAAAEDPAARPGMAAIAAALVPASTPLVPRRAPVTKSRRPHLLVAAVPLLALAAVSLIRDDGPAPRAEPVGVSTTTTTTVASYDGVIEHDGRRYALGSPGDVVLIGDWDCDGVDAPAVHRPATGQVWRFDEWPETAEPLAPRLVASAADAVEVRRGEGCDQLVVVDG